MTGSRKKIIPTVPAVSGVSLLGMVQWEHHRGGGSKMQSKFSMHLKALRKGQSMTQEQLADAMGVTVGAVHKWEQNLSVPDLSTMMELAGFFSVSLDALVGYEIKDNTAAAYAARIRELQQKKDYDTAAREAEQAIVRYPNQFAIIYESGQLYAAKGLETAGQADVEKAVELLQKAELLLPQNTDLSINRFTIEAEIAQCRIIQGRKDEALEILKQNNADGVHNALIGLTYATSETHAPEEAAPFLTKAFVRSCSELVRTMIGYANYYDRKDNLKSELEAVQWLLGYLQSVRPEEGTSYLDKLIAPLHSECARLQELLGSPEEAEQSLRLAFRTARQYDAAPTSSIGSLRFCLAQDNTATFFDDVGPSALDAIEEQIQREQWSDTLQAAWERIKETI